MSKKEIIAVVILCLASMLGVGIGAWSHIERLNADNMALLQTINNQQHEISRLTACAQRQIGSLLKICDANRILVVQGLTSSEWVEIPIAKPEPCEWECDGTVCRPKAKPPEQAPQKP